MKTPAALALALFLALVGRAPAAHAADPLGIRVQLREKEREIVAVPGVASFLVRDPTVAEVVAADHPGHLIVVGTQMGDTRILCPLADGGSSVVHVKVVPPYWDTLSYLFADSPNIEMVVTNGHLILSGEVSRNTVIRKVESAVALDPKRIINNVTFSHPDLLRRIDGYLQAQGYAGVTAEVLENTVYLGGQIFDDARRKDVVSVIEAYAKAANCLVNAAGLKLGGAPLAVEVKFVNVSRGVDNNIGLVMNEVKYNLNWNPKETDVWQFDNHVRSRQETASWELDGEVTNDGSVGMQRIRSGMKVLYETRMATRSGEQVRLQQGGTIYKETTGVQVTETTQVDYGFIVEITPTMIGPKSISADVNVQVSGVLKDDPLTLDKYNLQSKYTIAPGDIILVNRMNKMSDQVARQVLPYVGDIPMLGNLFANTKETDQDGNLLLLIRITPLTEEGVNVHGEHVERLYEETKTRSVKLEIIEAEEREKE
jgi:Flp pilus assembly secretin CpaC